MNIDELKQGTKVYDLDHLERGVGIIRNILSTRSWNNSLGKYTTNAVKVNFVRTKGIYYTIGYSNLDSLVDEATYLKFIKT